MRSPSRSAEPGTPRSVPTHCIVAQLILLLPARCSSLTCVPSLLPIVQQDWTKLGSHLAENYTHQLWPSTMRGPDQNQRIGKAAFLDVMDQLADGFIESYGVSPLCPFQSRRYGF